MATMLPRRAAFVCRSCQQLGSTTTQVPRPRLLSQAASPPKQKASLPPRELLSLPPRKRTTARASKQPSTDARTSNAATGRFVEGKMSKASALPPSAKVEDQAEQLKGFERFVAQVQSTDAAADHDAVLEQLMDMYVLSNVLVHGTTEVSDETTNHEPASQGQGIFDALEEEGDSNNAAASQSTHTNATESIESTPSNSPGGRQMTHSFRTHVAQRLCKLSYDLLRDPKVYITPHLLEFYVRIVCQLGRPEYLPEIFHLYATKPIPQTGSANPVKYNRAWPRLPKNAVPYELAEAALEVAILKRNLPLAFAIIDTTVAAPAFRTSKVLRKASVPAAIIGATPLIAYAAADWVSQWQNTMDTDLARWGAVAGSLAYVGTLSTIGFVAITTYNDQMQRVVWRPGTYLNKRWVREEERAFFDRLALAWGFREKTRWGEEVGPEWARLRDECGAREMILDKTNLMDGMQ